MTRRVITPPPTNPRWNNIGWLGWDDGHGYKMRVPYKAGDVLYIKETFRERYGNSYTYTEPADDWTEYEYKDGSKKGEIKTGWDIYSVQYSEWSKWKSPWYMPQAAARYFIRVTDVAVERLQDITDDDCWDEGVVTDPYDYQEFGYYEEYHESYQRSCFLGAWDSLNAKRGYSWSSNPWVVKICFKAISREEAERGAKC